MGPLGYARSYISRQNEILPALTQPTSHSLLPTAYCLTPLRGIHHPMVSLRKRPREERIQRIVERMLWHLEVTARQAKGRKPWLQKKLQRLKEMITQVEAEQRVVSRDHTVTGARSAMAAPGARSRPAGAGVSALQPQSTGRWPATWPSGRGWTSSRRDGRQASRRGGGGEARVPEGGGAIACEFASLVIGRMELLRERYSI